jgi:hypothetical protein
VGWVSPKNKQNAVAFHLFSGRKMPTPGNLLFYDARVKRSKGFVLAQKDF